MPSLEQLPLKAWQELLAKIPPGSRILSWLIQLDAYLRNMNERDPFTFDNGNRAVQTNPTTTFLEESDVTNTELSYVEGVTSGIQAQLDAKPDLSDNNTWTGPNTFTDTVTVDHIQFDLTPTSTTVAEGKFVWDADAGTTSQGMPGGSISGLIMQNMFVPKRPRNVSGGAMPRGTVVFISGETGAVPEISLADASTELLSNATIGFTSEDIANNARGHVTTVGLLQGTTGQPIDTSTFASGVVLWLSEAAGEFTDTKPVSPAHAVVVGKVNRVHATEGEIIVNIYNGFELFELHDVADGLSSATDGEMFAWNNSNSLWEQTVGFTYNFTTGAVTHQNSTDSVTGFQVLDADGGTPVLNVDTVNERVGIGDADPDTKLEVAGAVTIQELSTDPTDPAEGKAVFWKGDGGGTGVDGDLLYMEQSGGVVATGSLKYKDMVPSSITVNTGAVTGGTGVAGVQAMFDGNLLTIDEVTGVPGFDVEFVFSGVDRVPSFVVARWNYNGSATHYITIDIWNYNSTAWDQLRVFRDSASYFDSLTMYIPRASNSDYVSGGAAKLRMYHHTSGNASHDISIDYMGFTHSLQGVL